MINSTQHIDCYLIGIGNSEECSFTNEIVALISKHRLFSGGKRHLELVKDWLPEKHEWLPIQGKMEELVTSYQKRNEPVVIFVSGDPFFYGFGNTIKRIDSSLNLKSYPYFNSLQLLSHRLQLNYSEMKAVSVHGRSWKKLDEALLTDSALIGVLTDRLKSPAAIAERMIEFGYTNYSIIIGEELEGSKEKVNKLTLNEAVDFKSADLNCVLLRKEDKQRKSFGIEDADFRSLSGRPGMITKKAIRLSTLSALKLEESETFWDIGTCTGSIAIEAQRMYPHLDVIAFEKRTECEEIIKENTRKQRTLGIQIEIRDVFDMDLNDFVVPDAIFIGGHGNRLAEMITMLFPILKPNGKLVMNTVKKESTQVFIESCEKYGLKLQEEVNMQVNEYNPIKILTAIKS